MALTNKHHHIAKLIHTEADKILRSGKDNAEFLVGMLSYMEGFKKIIDNAAPGETDALCRQYSGFYEYAKLMEHTNSCAKEPLLFHHLCSAPNSPII